MQTSALRDELGEATTHDCHLLLYHAIAQAVAVVGLQVRSRGGFGFAHVMSAEERRAVHEIIYSIFELYELKVHGFLPPAIWKIRSPILKGCFRCHSSGRNLQAWKADM